MRLLDASAFRANAPPPLRRDEIHLWFFPLWPTPRASAESLPVRKLLAAYLDVPPRRVVVVRDGHGKPALCGDGLQFNLAHAGGAMLVGVSRDQVLGVDLEAPRKRRPVVALARRWFDPAEAAALAGLPPALRQMAFLRMWTCKEAMLKADGRGIAGGLRSVRLALDAQGQAVLDPAMRAKGAPWRVVALIPDAAHLGALAWRGPPRTIRAFVATAN